MLKKLTPPLAATASAEVTVDDQNVVNLLVALRGISDCCGFDLTAEANTMIDDFSASMDSKYSEAALRAAIDEVVELIRKQRDAAASVEAWCADKLSRGPSFWSEPNLTQGE